MHSGLGMQNKEYIIIAELKMIKNKKKKIKNKKSIHKAIKKKRNNPKSMQQGSYYLTSPLAHAHPQACGVFGKYQTKNEPHAKNKKNKAFPHNNL